MNNKSKYRFLIFLIIIIVILASLNNYINSSENIDHLAYVMAIGIDIGETSKYEISLKLSSLNNAEDSSSNGPTEGSSGSSSSTSSSSSNYVINTINSDSIDTAISIANSFTDKEINLSHCKVIVISEKLAMQGIEPIINSLVNKAEIRPDCNIIISKIDDNEFAEDKKPKMSDVLSKYFEVISSINTDNAYTISTILSKFYYDLNDDFYEPTATLGYVVNPEINTNSYYNSFLIDDQSKSLIADSSEPLVKTVGMAVFKGDKMVRHFKWNRNIMSFACYK